MGITDVDHTPLARLGRWAHRKRKLVLGVWALLTIAIGVFAPKLEHALSGAMWEVKGSDSLAAREVIDEQFGGLSSQSARRSSSTATPSPSTTRAFQQAITDATAALATSRPSARRCRRSPAWTATR
jgi:RND superfamily putative drug exporter